VFSSEFGGSEAEQLISAELERRQTRWQPFLADSCPLPLLV
jgi:hypothetical protein